MPPAVEGRRTLVTDASAPAAGPLRVQFIVNQRQEGAVLSDAPLYPPADPGDAGATLTVAIAFRMRRQPIARDTWRFAPSAGAPRLEIRAAVSSRGVSTK